jgi:hypothetical protein
LERSREEHRIAAVRHDVIGDGRRHDAVTQHTAQPAKGLAG